MRIYSLVFLAAVFVAGASGFTLRGLPFPGTLRIASRADSSYRAVGPAYSFGFTLALINLFCAAFGCIPRISAISLKVKPSMLSISANIVKKIKNVSHLREFTYSLLSKKNKKNENFSDLRQKSLDKMSDFGDNYI
ncbi:MAG: hypothetical protein LBF74_05655 [Treponema sp.]|jgi:hypothetical protein|nr:hypothetical protein [Treponema sp.]